MSLLLAAGIRLGILRLTNGWALRTRLLDAMDLLDVPHEEDAAHKKRMQDLAKRGGPYTDEEKKALLVYCESDVVNLRKLYFAIVDRMPLDLERALLRGRYMCSCARIERTGVPIDMELLSDLRAKWDHIRDDIWDSAAFLFPRVFTEGGSISGPGFEWWLRRRGLLSGWPRTRDGSPCSDRETLRDWRWAHPDIERIRQFKMILSGLRAEQLTVGDDGRNRTLLGAFGSKTGRNQPKTSEFIFASPSWMRRLVQPKPGSELCYLDWKQQEFGICAALSQDANMLSVYSSGDPYLAFAKMTHAVPLNATKVSHAAVREQYKTLILGLGYLMGTKALASAPGPSYKRA